MKKNYILSLVAAATMLCAGAEVASAKSYSNDFGGVNISEDFNYSSASSSSSKSYSKPKGSFEFDYSKLEGSPIMGLNLNLGGLVISGEYQPTGAPVMSGSGIDEQTAWGIGAGLNKRIYLCKFLFIEGRAGAMYRQCKTTFEDDRYDDIENGSWGLYASPRVALKLVDNLCITAGYKWNFAEFKTTEEYTTKYSTIGISFIF